MNFDKNFNNNFYTEALQYQYYNSNIGEFLKGVGRVSEVFINQAIESLFNDVVNLRTATGAALDMWGRRLGFSRFIPTDTDTPKDYKNFNFYDMYFNKVKFNDSNMHYVGLPDFNYRIILLLLLAQQSITPNIKAIEDLVNEIFKKLNISIIVKDTTDMSYVTYIFKKEIPEWLGWIFKNYDVFPRPAGVGASYIVDLRKPFSFDRDDIALNKEITNFYYGNFTEKTQSQFDDNYYNYYHNDNNDSNI